MPGHTNPLNISRAELAELHRRKVAARERVRTSVQSARPAPEDPQSMHQRVRAYPVRAALSTSSVIMDILLRLKLEAEEHNKRYFEFAGFAEEMFLSRLRASRPRRKGYAR